MEVLKRLKFWIGLGLLALASGVVLGVWFLPARQENSQRADEWEKLVTQVTGVAEKPVAARGQAAEYEKTMKEVAARRRELEQSQAGGAVDLAAPIPDPDTGEQRDDLEAGIWKFVYEKAMNALERDTMRSFVRVDARELVRMREFPGVWPTEEEVAEETRSYWVQRYLLEALASVNADRMTAPYLDEFELLATPERLLAPSDATAYQPQGFMCKVKAEFSMVPFIIDRLMHCAIPVSVTSIEVARSEDVLERAARSRVLEQKQLVEADVVGGRAGRGGAYGMPPGMGPGVDAGAAQAAAAQAAAARMAEQMAAAMGGARGRPQGPSRAARRRTRRDEEDTEPRVEARHIPTALVEVTIKGYANVPRPEKKAEAEPESEET